MKKEKSIPLDPETEVSVSWILDGRTFSIKVPSKVEKSYRDASKLIGESYAKWKLVTSSTPDYDDFSRMNLVAIEALSNGLRVQEEYQELLRIVNEGLGKVQSELSSDD
jgi:hypothetical protein